MVLFVVQFYPVCNFGEFINFGLGTARSERDKQVTLSGGAFIILSTVLS